MLKSLIYRFKYPNYYWMLVELNNYVNGNNSGFNQISYRDRDLTINGKKYYYCKLCFNDCRTMSITSLRTKNNIILKVEIDEFTTKCHYNNNGKMPEIAKTWYEIVEILKINDLWGRDYDNQ